MNAPLWRIMLGIMVLAFVAHRAAVAFVLAVDGQSTLFVLALGAQCAAGLFLWAALMWIARAVVPALIAVGVTVAAGAAVGALVHAISPMVAASQIGVALIGTALFAYMARRAIEHDASSR